jgi:hypothetical protein
MRGPVQDRFMSKVEFDPNGGCWLWAASDDGSRGYGRFGPSPYGTRQAHRVAYELFCEPIPAGLEIDHKCRVPACVNPDHLEPVTREENMRRAPKSGLKLGGKANGERLKNATHCKRGHEYAKHGGVSWIGGRYCKKCHSIRQASYKAGA